MSDKKNLPTLTDVDLENCTGGNAKGGKKTIPDKGPFGDMIAPDQSGGGGGSGLEREPPILL